MLGNRVRAKVLDLESSNLPLFIENEYPKWEGLHSHITDRIVSQCKPGTHHHNKRHSYCSRLVGVKKRTS